MRDEDSDQLKEILHDPTLSADAKLEVRKATRVMIDAMDSIRPAYSAPLPPCLQGLNADQLKAIEAMCEAAGLDTIRDFAGKVVVETARLAAEATRRH